MASFHGQCYWSKKDILMLLDHMEKNLPFDDNLTFKKAQTCLDWGKVAFKHFSGEMCKVKWLEISNKLRKYRTLSDLVQEAKERIKNPNRNKEYEKHPDFPKRPLTAYIRFYKEKWAKYSQKYPKMSNQELAKVLSKKYKQLPEHIKQSYIRDFQKEKQEFKEKLVRFREDHPDLVQVYKTSGVSKIVRLPPKTEEFSMEVKFHGEPKKPPMNAYHKFHQDSWSSQELQHLPLRERMVEISRRWQRVPQSLKEHYKNLAEMLQKQYRVDLDLWLKTLSPKEYAAYREAVATYGKRKNLSLTGGSNPKLTRSDVQSTPGKYPSDSPEDDYVSRAPRLDWSETVKINYGGSQESKQNMKEEIEEAEGSSSSDSTNGDDDAFSGKSSSLDSI
ncbi:upstream-binding factor 1-like protein 1 [Perognathus longimembris pacificus]|uniref:upstream-binding factor 1-like protein 1 n=1 Tax=Perognathus longimembris pacificus TaxID=214514 RepID=UPI0020194E75|nr:upstream-binding factor 1-like protein 1 [Perognathus longimembris pacificus]